MASDELKPTTVEERERLAQLCEKATPGPFEHSVTLNDECVVIENHGPFRNLLCEVADAREHWTADQRRGLTMFVAAACNLAPRLLADIKRRDERIAELEAAQQQTCR